MVSRRSNSFFETARPDFREREREGGRERWEGMNQIGQYNKGKTQGVTTFPSGFFISSVTPKRTK